MREIKFMAWHIGRKQMCIKPFGMGEYPEFKCSDGVVRKYSTAFFRKKIMEIMQYTGLNDATWWEGLTEDERAEWVRDGNSPKAWKGKCIFEGNILRGGIESNPQIQVVKFNPAYGCPMRFKPDHEWGDNDRGAGEFLDRMTISSNIGYKVIGDIYSTPELLKGIA